MQALALGWAELALFGLNPRAPWTRVERMGASRFGPPRVLAAEAIVDAGGDRIGRARQAAGATLPWELEV